MSPLKSLSRLFRPRVGATAQQLYGAIVSQARQPVFYTRLGVPDTVDGRFDMIVLFAALLMRRLRREPQGAELAQDVFDLMFLDMDHSLREMGAGDLSVPKKVRAMAEAFYGRARAYDAALDEGGEAALAGAIARNIYAAGEGTDVSSAASELARHVAHVERELARQPGAVLRGGQVSFPRPDA